MSRTILHVNFLPTFAIFFATCIPYVCYNIKNIGNYRKKRYRVLVYFRGSYYNIFYYPRVKFIKIEFFMVIFNTACLRDIEQSTW